MMKNTVYILLVLTAMLSVSCAEIGFGDHALSDPPESSGATIDTLFASAANADKVLVAAYSFLPYGLPVPGEDKLGSNVLESITDLQHSHRNNIHDGPRNLYYNGALSNSIGDQAGYENYRFGHEKDYYTIRYAMIFIENAGRIPDIREVDRARMIGEAKVCIAIAYFNLLRYCGGVPLLDHAVDVNEEMFFKRNTFSETVEFIIRMLDEAKDVLPWTNSAENDGRMTMAAALGLKLKVLCFAASATFNADKPYHPQANEYQCYGNYDVARWQRAADAADEFKRMLDKYGYYDLVQPKAATPEARRLAYRSAYFDRGTCESIISIRQGFSPDLHGGFITDRLYSSPTLNWVNMFPWSDGTDFPEDFDWENPDKYPFFEPDGSGNPPGKPTRDPRLYENVAVPGGIYYDGTVAPLHTNHPKYRPDGTGFSPMKFVLQDDSDRAGKAPHWPYMRFAEVLLNAAEAYNEAHGGPTAEAYRCVNRVRERVGLPGVAEGLDQQSFRKALLHERCLEFGYEEIRWFDMIRWGLEDDFRKTLYGLSSKGNDQNKPTAFTFSTFELPERAWVDHWDTKWYLAPIPQGEIDKKYGMTQNPGW